MSGLSISIDVSIGSGGVGAPDPRAIFNGSAFGFLIDAASGATVNGSNQLTALSDLSGAGNHFAGAGGNPLYSASGGPNGAPCFSTNGTTYLKNASYDAPSTGTSPLLICLVAKIDTWVTTKELMIVGQVASGFIEIFTFGSASKIACDGRVGNIETGGAWKRIYLQLDATLGNCFLRAGANQTLLSGLNVVNPAAGASFGATDTGTLGLAASYAYSFAVNALASPEQLAANDAYLVSRFGSGLVA